MMKITPEKLAQAATIAREIVDLEARKDTDAPKGLVRECYHLGIEMGHKELAELGFELLPPAGYTICAAAASSFTAEDLRPGPVYQVHEAPAGITIDSSLIEAGTVGWLAP